MMELKGLKALVTGADGFIGSHLVEALVKKGANVRAFVFYNAFNSCGWLDTIPDDLLNKIEIFSGDIRDLNGVRKAVKDADIIFHLAALIGIPYSYQSPESYVETNIRGTLNILQAGREFKVKKIIHTSTSEVYGTAKFVPINENHLIMAQSPYAASKIAADQMALSFYKSFGTPVFLLRPFNTYGPRQSMRAVIPTIITQIVAGQSTIKLGSTYPTRDFGFIKDVVQGFIAAAKAENSLGEIVQLGTNFEISIGDTARLIGELMGKKINIVATNERIRPDCSEVDRLLSDNSKAKKILNWHPEYSGMEGFKKGLMETIRWFVDSDNLKHYKLGNYVV